jgi:hypothetical protein
MKSQITDFAFGAKWGGRGVRSPDGSGASSAANPTAQEQVAESEPARPAPARARNCRRLAGRRYRRKIQ